MSPCDGWGKDAAILVSCFRPGSAVEGPHVFTEAFQPPLRKADESFFSSQSNLSRAGMGMKRLLNWGTAFSIESVRFFRMRQRLHPIQPFVLLPRT